MNVLTIAVPEHGHALEQGSLRYLKELQLRQLEPGLLIEKESLAAAVATLGGAQGLTPPDSFKDFQFNMDMYIGVTTPAAKSEAPHWHPDQTEIYAVQDGEAELMAKYRWVDDGWKIHRARPGCLLIVKSQVCHWFQWVSDIGFAYVFKAPQRPGIGRFPAGKQDCTGGNKPEQGCPHYNNGCVLPRNSRGIYFDPRSQTPGSSSV